MKVFFQATNYLEYYTKGCDGIGKLVNALLKYGSLVCSADRQVLAAECGAEQHGVHRTPEIDMLSQSLRA